MDRNMEDGLSGLRLRGVFALTAVSWLATITIIACAFSTGSVVAPLQALGVTIIPTVLAWQRRHDVAARIALGVALPLYPAILLGQWHSAPWQIDLHMVFFAVLAVIAVLADWRPVVAAAGVTAVHHLLLDLVAPEYVFGASGDLARVVLHAVIVIIETAVLVMLAKQVEHLVIGQARARAAQAEVEAAAQAERARHEAEQRTVIDALRTRLLALSAGQVGTRLDVPFPAAYEELRRAVNDACQQLLALIGEVNNASQFITSGVDEIRAASNDLAHRTEEQASALEQNSSITRRLSDQITQNAVQAAQVDGAIRDAQTDARQGGEVVEQAMVAMTEIEKSSAEIGQIISMIDGIAFQTNLLALNAGVEAARAGEAGKGFAVVASEVRALAQRSAEAASTIKQLVTGSGQQVARGVELVARTGKSLEALVGRFADIGDAVGEIARSAAAQAGDLRQVTTAFGQIDHATQQNAAMVEESNAAAQGLAREVERLVDSVSRFDTATSRPGGTGAARLRAV